MPTKGQKQTYRPLCGRIARWLPGAVNACTRMLTCCDQRQRDLFNFNFIIPAPGETGNLFALSARFRGDWAARNLRRLVEVVLC